MKIFKALGEPTRLKILKLVALRPMYVCELEMVLGISQPRISQHLRVLKEAGLLSESKEAQRTFYALKRQFLQENLAAFQDFLAAPLSALPAFAAEAVRLAEAEEAGLAEKCCPAGECGRH
ncbi:MAG: ArsR/SmtB family transcription factor [Desulfurispora sp.]|uniref:ArsR/SmtB family transcription factor n=1 Tax=Desulfurispora sp. TaxID=3014275 RepID=UPI00404A0B18